MTILLDKHETNVSSPNFQPFVNEYMQSLCLHVLATNVQVKDTYGW